MSEATNSATPAVGVQTAAAASPLEQFKPIGKELLQALMAVQQTVGGVRSDKTNSHLKNRYPSIGAVLEELKPALSEAGCLLIQPVVQDMDSGVTAVWTIIVHIETQQALGHALTLVTGACQAQQLGSAVTYLRRYGPSALMAMWSDDDDGNGAPPGRPMTGNTQQRSTGSRSTQPPPAQRDWNPNETKAAIDRIQTLDALEKGKATILAKKIPADREKMVLGWIEDRRKLIAAATS